METGTALIIKAMQEEHRERIRRQWIALLPVMYTTGVCIGFEEYYDDVTGRNIDTRPTEVILQELDEVERQFEEL